MRIVRIRDVGLWVGSVTLDVLVEVPDEMDLYQEEAEWRAKGGGTPEGFVWYIVAKGAHRLSVALHVINQQ